ncbi:Sec1-like protein [Saitoella complicata NRRL Y-17804]|uniref:Sec1-like protein n=1 Tax=Saitoella complicata (strain BCRC 22490 / CBS 7301 / JCM 7358 / NBRC 10748 / NRRL Y-17804) TaxID=698492 RepID=UPI00086747AC|nr:Sec1-like protein [Saitoella complicata NRRL Y-17804]ODQ55485.1 Sec1-like protein [Saitoella complicata NRRL Y-17804]
MDTSAATRSALLDALDSVRGKKYLVLDRSLSGPIGLIVKFSVLQDHGVEKIFWLEEGPIVLPNKSASIVYLCRSTVKNVRNIVGHIKEHAKDTSNSYDYTLLFTPRRTMICQKILEDEGVFGDVTISEFPLLFVTLEPDVLSLELDSAFEDIYLHHDYSSIFYSAQALMKLQESYGLFPRVLGKGDKARQLTDLLLRMRKEVAVDDPLNPGAMSSSTVLDSLIIIDRGVDMATPLMTQLTYEGLIDESYGIKNGYVELPPSIVAPTQTTGKSSSSGAPISDSAASATQKKKTLLNSTDKLYGQLRDTNFSVVGGLLNRVAKRLNENYDERHQAKTVTQLKGFVGKLGGLQAEHQSLRLHTAIAEEIMAKTGTEAFNKTLEVQQNLVAGVDPSTLMPVMEELIARSVPIADIIRLLSLASVMNGGIKPKDLEHLKREVLQTYGHEHILTFAGLHRLGLLVPKISGTAALTSGTPSQKYSYNQLRKGLKLIVDEVNEHDPQDVAYVYSGYAPLSVRLVQTVIQKRALLPPNTQSKGSGWKDFEDILKYVKGPAVDETQRDEDDVVRVRRPNSGQEKITVVFFVGGVTYTEISALRLLAQQEKGKKQIVVATTGILNGEKVVDAAMSAIPDIKQA